MLFFDVKKSSHSFSKQNRLLQPKEFQRVLKKGKRLDKGDFRFFYCSNFDNEARLGIAVSKKAVKTAVGRNGIRRTIRESFRRNKETFKGLDIVVVVKKKPELLNKQYQMQQRENILAIWQLLEKSLKK